MMNMIMMMMMMMMTTSDNISRRPEVVRVELDNQRMI